METDFTRPSFLASYFGVMTERARADGWWSVVPGWGIFAVVAGTGAVYFLPKELWTETQNWQAIIAVYAAIVTINGLLLALSWSAFARIHDLLVSSPEFAVLLRRSKLFNGYLFYVDWVQAAQTWALLVGAAGMFSSVVAKIPLLGHRIILAYSVATTVYAIRSAANAVTVTHDLIWQRAIFEEQELESKGKVVSISRAQESEAQNNLR
jgi:hypothetical protein